MASQSDSPPNPLDEKPRNPVLQVSQAAVDDRQIAEAETAKESSPTSVFVNSEPIREDQVQNAVKFLSHPKVRGSPVIHRRSFLERKGLKKEEIDEAFRRVPDPTPAVTASEPVATNPDGQLKSSSNIQSQAPTQTLQPGPVASVGSISIMQELEQQYFSRLKDWMRRVVVEEEEDDLLKKNNTKTRAVEEAAAAAKAAAAAASDVARTSQEMLMSKTEERRCFEELINTLNAQVREMQSMSNAMQKLEVRSLSPPAFVEPSVAPHTKSYGQIVAMIQRGEKPSNIREINDAPPNSNQLVPNPRLAPRAKPWEVGQVENFSSNALQSQGSVDGLYYEFHDNQSITENKVPWWEQKNAQIAEIEAGDEERFGSSNVVSNERPVQRSWVPPATTCCYARSSCIHSSAKEDISFERTVD